MKIKEIDQTAHIAWSPAAQHPIYLAAGTAAQQLDASFSTTANLELYSLDLNEPGLNMGLKTSITTKQRFHKLVWGSQGMESGDRPSGVLVGGADQGHISIYDAAGLLSADPSKSLISESKKHTGPVKSLDFNPSQLNLLASGATDSEIYIWDLNSPGTPMTPGTQSQPPDDVTCLAWNRQVQHILASTFASRCVVWDLRKNEPIIKVSDSTSRMRCKSVAWHPEAAIQLCLASEDDRMPVIQLWDLRFATSPLKTFEGHQRGILSMAWCPQDPDLLMSCGKDNRVLIWNANTQQPNGEILSELSTSNQWCFDAGWCPRNPSVIAAASFDGRIRVHSIMGGRELSLQTTSNMIADSFPGMEAPVAGDYQQQQTVIIHPQLKKPPSWLRPVCGASFGFGGKLVSFGIDKASHEKPQVYLSQVITEEELVVRSKELESALQVGNIADLCTSKAQSASDQQVRATWDFLGANFSSSPRQQLLHLLGYELPDSDIQKSIDQLGIDDNQLDAFDSLASDVTTLSIPTDDSTDGRISKFLLTGDLTSAVDLCFKDKRYADALVLAMAGPPELLNATRERYFRVTQGNVSRLIQAVVTRNWLQIVQNCDLSNWKEALAATLTYADDHEFVSLCQTIGQRLENESKATEQAVLCYICAGNLEKLVDCWLLKNDNSTAALQELVEQVMVLRQAQQQLGRSSSVSGGSGNLTSQFCRYAGLLAAQGNLQTALTYLDMSQDSSMVELKERLQRALGIGQPAVGQRQVGRQASGGFVNGVHSTGISQLPSRPQYPQMMAPKPATPVNHYFNDPYGSVPSVPTYNASGRPSTPHQSWGSPSVYNPVPPSQPAAPPPPAVPSHPAPPPSIPSHQSPAPPPAAVAPPPPAQVAQGSLSARGGLVQRSRYYVQDPSLFGGSAPRTVQSSYLNDGASQYMQQPSVFSQPAFQPNPNLFQPASTPLSTPYNPTFTPAPAQPSFQVNQFAPQPTQPLVNGTTTSGETNPAIYNPAEHAPAQPVFNSSVRRQSTDGSSSQPLPPRTPPVVPASNPPPGWNDPPQLTMISKPKMEALAEPITHPIFGTAPEQPVQPPSFYNPASGGMDPGLHPVPSNIPAEAIGAEMAVPAMQPSPAIVAAPIPSEHQVIHDVFNVLKDRCNNLASNAQMKRKLEDVNRKLENLDERLRNNMLSSNTLHGLHQLVQAARIGDYNTCLALHTQLVSTTNFTEIGSFMPGLKVLIQMSAQLGVQAQ